MSEKRYLHIDYHHYYLENLSRDFLNLYFARISRLLLAQSRIHAKYHLCQGITTLASGQMGNQNHPQKQYQLLTTELYFDLM